MAHYYTNNTDLKSETRIITFDYQDKRLEFLSDLGVFSKDSIDESHVISACTVP